MGWKAFVEGGAASIVAGTVTHPIDLVKVRLQLPAPALALPASGGGAVNPAATRGAARLVADLVRADGVRALFSGVSATVLRQSLYSTTRLGLYDILKKRSSEGKGDASMASKVAAGLAAGGVGAAVGNPADVALVRMQAGRSYGGVAHALASIVREEGVAALWSGAGPTVQRAMVVTAAQLATYDEVKGALLAGGAVKDGMAAHVASSCAAGLVAAVASNPIDVVKTRLMTCTGEEGYRGPLDCALKTVRSEGPMALYKGFVPTVARQGPFAIVLFVTLEQVKKLIE